MTIRVFGAPDCTRPDVDRASTGTDFLKSRQARAHHAPPEVQTIRKALGPIVAAERVEPGEGALRVTLFHLVSTGDVDAYRQRLLGLDLAPHRLRVSGPWPPFAFSPDLF